MRRLLSWLILTIMFTSGVVAQTHYFRGDTPVLMSDGTLKPISQLKWRDRVMTYDLGTGQYKVQRVRKVIKTKQPVDLVRMGYRIEGESGMSNLYFTPGTPLLSLDGEWVSLNTLLPTLPLKCHSAAFARLVLPKVAVKGGPAAQRAGTEVAYTLKIKKATTLIAGGLIVPAK